MTTTNTSAANPPPKKRRGPTVNVAEMVRDYNGGMGIRAVAEQHDISYGKAHSMLHQAGVEMRERGSTQPVVLDDDEIEPEQPAERVKGKELGGMGKPRGSHKNFTDEQANAWRTEYDADRTLRIVDLAERHHVDHAVMRSALVWAGGALRSGGETKAARNAARL